MSLTNPLEQNATLSDASVDIDFAPIYVWINPTEFGIDRGVHYADANVPGLEMPLLQFVRGDSQQLTLELLVDSSDTRASDDYDGKVENRLAQIRRFVEIDPELHAPPVCRFNWKDIEFTGVVTSLRERYQLFDEKGKVLRARVTLTLKSYKASEVQLREASTHSPDRTRVRAVREGETLARIAQEAYGDPRLWRVIAEANGIDRPRFVAPGTPLRIPAIT